MTRSRRRRRRPMPLDPVNKRVQRMHVSSRRNVECSRSSCCPVLACHRTGAPSVYAVLGEATHFYTSYNTEGSTTRTLTSPSTPASNAQMAFAFVATRPVRRRRRPDRPAAAPPGPAARVVARAGPCRGRHVAKRNAPATAQPAVVAMPPPTMPANGDGDRLGDRKGLEPLGSRALGRRCRRALACGLAQRRSSVPVRPLVAAHASISSRTHTSESSPRNVHRLDTCTSSF